MRAFKRLEDGYLSAATCRWRPCHESASFWATIATRRRVRLAPDAMRAFLTQGWLTLEELEGYCSRGLASGCEECGMVPELTVEGLGGLLVGLLPPPAAVAATSVTTGDTAAASSGITASLLDAAGSSGSGGAGGGDDARLWIAGVVTGKRVESFADKAELEIALAQLH